tara:strand:+ start:701 stop:883 length:183 start_codon:yes stop_codon:yes gene_type:complete
MIAIPISVDELPSFIEKHTPTKRTSLNSNELYLILGFTLLVTTIAVYSLSRKSKELEDGN